MKIQTEAQRAKLAPRREPYWTPLCKGEHLGFRKTETGGSWVARRTVDRQRTYNALGSEADLTFTLAAKAATEWFEQEAGPAPSKLTIGDVVSARLTRLHKEGSSSYKPACSHFDNHIGPWLSRKRVVDLKMSDYEAFLADINLHGNTVKQIWADLLSSLNAAYRKHKTLPAEEWRSVKTPKGGAGKRRIFMKQDEITRLINAAHDPDLRDLLMFAALNGGRPGEIYHMFVRDVDADAGLWTVEKSKVRTKGKPAQVRPLTRQAVEIIKRRSAGRSPMDRVFTRGDGRPWNSDLIKKPLRVAVRRAELDPEICMYSLRHSFISNQLLNGAQPAMIAQATGTSLTQIDRHYGHFAKRDMQQALEANGFQFDSVESNVITLK